MSDVDVIENYARLASMIAASAAPIEDLAERCIQLHKEALGVTEGE